MPNQPPAEPTSPETDDPNLDAPVKRRDVLALHQAVVDLAGTNRWRRVAYALVGASLAVNGLVAYQGHALASCVQHNAARNAARTNLISPLTFAQLKAINDAFQSLTIKDRTAATAAFTQAQRDELAAFQTYRDVYGDHPPPPVSSLAC